jgi:hypothetical protein
MFHGSAASRGPRTVFACGTVASRNSSLLSVGVQSDRAIRLTGKPMTGKHTAVDEL